MTNDSRTGTTGHDVPAHGTSEPQDGEWGQPAASRYEFAVVNGVLYGQPIGTLSPSLVAELEAWDAASDEALVNFETAL